MAKSRVAVAYGFLAAILAFASAGDHSYLMAQDTNPNGQGYLVIKVNLSGTAVPAAAAVPGAPVQPAPVPGGEGSYPLNVPPPGYPGAVPPGFPGAGGFRPGMPVPGDGMPPAVAPGAAATAPKFVIAVVPFYKIFSRTINPQKPVNRILNPTSTAVQISTEKNATSTAPFLYADNSSIQLYLQRNPAPDQFLALRHKKEWLEKGRPLEVIYDLIGEAIIAGLPERAVSYFNDMKKSVEARKDPSNQDRFARAVKAFEAAAPSLEAAHVLPADRSEELWKVRLQAAGIYESPHYAIVHFGDQFVGPDALARRAEMLEKNYKLFYLWNALNGRGLPVLKKRLTVILPGKSSEMSKIREALDGVPGVADSFYSPTHNVLVMSPERTDDSALAFSRFVQGYWQSGWSRDDLLRGKAPVVGPKGKLAEDVFRMTTLALVERKLDEEGEYAAVSRDGTRQLFSATGVLAPHVLLPGWVESGVANLLGKPKGPVLTYPLPGAVPQPGMPVVAPNVPTTITVGIQPGYGGPNYAMMRKWRDLVARKEVTMDPVALLRNTITDQYFDAVRTGVDADVIPGAAPVNPEAGIPVTDAPGVPGGVPGAPPADPVAEARAKTARLDGKAQAIAWALTYFLNKTRSDRLSQFYAELNQMPRDMHLSPEQVMGAFCRSFDLMAADQTGVDERKFAEFAVNWLKFMNSVRPSGADIPMSSFTGEQVVAPMNP